MLGAAGAVSSASPLAGLELFFLDEGRAGRWGAPSALFTLASPEAREVAVSKLRGQAVLGSGLPGGRPAADACASILEVSLHEHVQDSIS